MYWRSGQYEVLRDYDRKTRDRIVGQALARYGRSSSRRILLVFAGWIGAVFWRVVHATHTHLRWDAWIIPVAGGVAFYLYLLWELNGPIRAAVERYVKEGAK